MSKDYTISHGCGCEVAFDSFATAKSEAKKHKKACTKNEAVFIDEYDFEQGELTSNFWKV